MYRTPLRLFLIGGTVSVSYLPHDLSGCCCHHWLHSGEQPPPCPPAPPPPFKSPVIAAAKDWQYSLNVITTAKVPTLYKTAWYQSFSIKATTEPANGHARVHTKLFRKKWFFLIIYFEEMAVSKKCTKMYNDAASYRIMGAALNCRVRFKLPGRLWRRRTVLPPGGVLQKLYGVLFSRRGAAHYTDASVWFSIGLCATFATLAVARIMALYYGGWRRLVAAGGTGRRCLGW